MKDSSRSQFYLLPDRADEKLSPFAIAMLDLGSRLQFSLYLDSRDNFPGRLFSRQEKYFHTQVSLALRTSDTISEEFWLDDQNQGSPELSRLFRRAVTSRDSAGYYDDKSSQQYFAWRFNEKTPIILAGSVALVDNVQEHFIIAFAPFFVAILLILILLLVAEIVSRIFLSPLSAMTDAVKYISDSGDVAVKVEISNNDEFDQVGESFNQMVIGLLQKKHISRFVSQRLVNAIENSSAETLNQSSEMQRMTILAADIRNFTAISENHPPELVVEILNEYFTLMEDCILSEGGIIDKFIGDAIIAVFLAENCPKPELSACRTAFKMRHALAAYDFKKEFDVSITNGVGIATGGAIAANLGRSFSRRDFTVVGDMVHVAEMLEAFTKSGNHSRIMIDEETRRKVYDQIRVTEALKIAEMRCFELIEEVKGA